jgi:hypothetical protein
MLATIIISGFLAIQMHCSMRVARLTLDTTTAELLPQQSDFLACPLCLFKSHLDNDIIV